MLDDSSDWSLVWEEDYTAERQGTLYQLIIGEIKVPVPFTAPTIAIQISQLSHLGSYSGYILQRTGGTFPAYISDSYKPFFYHNGATSIFTFEEITNEYYLSFVPNQRIKHLHLEVFEYTGEYSYVPNPDSPLGKVVETVADVRKITTDLARIGGQISDLVNVVGLIRTVLGV